MSDSRLRDLEREHRADPSDEAALWRLQDERVRLGLGWHGERLPANLYPLCAEETGRDDARGAYGYRIQGAPPPRVHPLELVWVPSARPFYVGRFPVLWGAQSKRDEEAGSVMTRRYHPVTNLSVTDVRKFCAKLGLRLLTSAEWTWAALGEREPSFPWGNAPPTVERAVWRDHPDYGPFDSQWSSAYNVGYSAPCLVEARDRLAVERRGSGLLVAEDHVDLVLARPAGASWCGALEMAGNVAEWVELGGGRFDRLGCSWRDLLLAGVWPREVDHAGEKHEADRGYDHIGFRVALDGEDP